MALFDKVTVIGVGLIGGSLARAMKRAALCATVTGCGPDEAGLRQAQQLGVIDRYSLDVGEAVVDADLVALATPLLTMAPLLRTLAGRLPADCIVTDVGSAKGVVVAAAREIMPQRLSHFVPAHPVAGTERSGVEASSAELFTGQITILTPLPETAAAARDAVAALWQGVGATTVELTVERHDQVLAATSHLPHVLAYTLVDCLARLHDRDEVFAYAAGGFRDFTRIASSDPEMWRDICLTNGDALLAMLDHFQQGFQTLRAAVQAGDGERLYALFARAKQARDEYAIT